ncbi:MAG: sodium:calcium antiporter [Pseudomonadota bacterium]|nr:sodium:calcium antiporter [Pseudomonadota bacterium]
MTPGIFQFSLLFSILIFLAAAVVIAIFGVRMTHVARQLAIRTRMGEALMGTIFIGASTSLSGIMTSVTTASYGYAELSVSNALGGIAAQMLFLAIADMFYRKANLEHAAASAENLMMTAFLIILLSILLFATTVPHISIYAIHPASPLLIIFYLFSIHILARTHQMPMWVPKNTRDTRHESTNKLSRRVPGVEKLWIQFAICAAMVAMAGWVLAQTGMQISQQTGLSQGVVGGVFTAISTSLPELVIAVAAVRMKSLTLAVGDIVGGNLFDTLFIAVSDFAYREGSIYAAISSTETTWLAITLIMSGILMVGLLHRERHGPGNIGWESVLLIIAYLVGLLALILS